MCPRIQSHILSPLDPPPLGAPEDKKRGRRRASRANNQVARVGETHTLRRDILAELVAQSGLRRPPMPKGVVKKGKKKKGARKKKKNNA